MVSEASWERPCEWAARDRGKELPFFLRHLQLHLLLRAALAWLANSPKWRACSQAKHQLVTAVLLTGCGKKIKIVRDFGGKLCGEKHRLCGNCAGLRNLSTYQIFRDCEQELPEKYTATYCIDCSFQWYKLTRPFSALIYLRYIINITWIKT